MSYSPTIGRFVQPDPIGYGDGMSLYEFVGSNPVIDLDPMGLSVLRASQTLNLGQGQDLDKLKKICGTAFTSYDIEDRADRSEILDQLKQCSGNDVWIYLGHGLADSTGKVVAIEEHDGFITLGWLIPPAPFVWGITNLFDGPANDPVYAKDLQNAASNGGTKKGPGLVVLGGCKGSDLADTFIKSGSKCVVSSKTEIDSGVSSTMIDSLMKKLTNDNMPIEKAVREVEKELSLGGRRDIQLDLSCSDPKYKTMTLPEILK